MIRQYTARWRLLDQQGLTEDLPKVPVSTMPESAQAASVPPKPAAKQTAPQKKRAVPTKKKSRATGKK